jgi:hypothetical protein
VRRTIEIGFSLLVVIAVAWVVAQASSWLLAQLTGWDLPRGWGRRSGLFPTVIGIPVLVLAAVQLVSSLRRARLGAATGTPTMDVAVGEGEDVPPDVARQRSAIIIATILGFAIGVALLGFTVAIPVVTFLYLRFASSESWTLSVSLAAIAGIAFYLLFVEALRVPIPNGLLIEPLIG